MKQGRGLLILVGALLAVGAPAQARTEDPIGDFIGTFAGPQNGDVDVVSTQVFFDGANFSLTATLDAPIGTTPGALYVWGFDRGQGTARFSTGGSPIPNTDGVLFDSVVILRPDTTVTVSRIVGGGVDNFGVGTALISGNTLSATIPASTLPGLGLLPSQYTFNLWPRVGTGNNNQISDFAPDNSNAAVTLAPEPASCGLILCAGFALLLRRRRK